MKQGLRKYVEGMVFNIKNFPVKSGKFTLRSRKQFSQVSHVPFEGHGLLFYHLFDTRYFPEPY